MVAGTKGTIDLKESPEQTLPGGVISLERTLVEPSASKARVPADDALYTHMDLLEYGSDSDQDGPEGSQQSQLMRKAEQDALATAKRPRKLPALGGTFDLDPVDDPAQHQGRQRSRPFVQGDWNAHVYLSLKPSKRLREALDAIVARLTEKLPDAPVHSLLDPPEDGPPVDRTLHVSLSHPLPLRRDQVALLLDHLRASSRGGRPGRSARITLVPEVVTYQNGEAAVKDGLENRAGGAAADAEGRADDDGLLAGLGRSGIGRGGRAFLALRVGTGHDQLAKIQDDLLTPFLKRHHLPLYHSNPEFHASFAWTLAQPIASAVKIRWANPFTASALERINTDMSEVERAIGKGWEVDELEVKVGKTVTRISLG